MNEIRERIFKDKKLNYIAGKREFNCCQIHTSAPFSLNVFTFHPNFLQPWEDLKSLWVKAENAENQHFLLSLKMFRVFSKKNLLSISSFFLTIFSKVPQEYNKKMNYLHYDKVQIKSQKFDTLSNKSSLFILCCLFACCVL